MTAKGASARAGLRRCPWCGSDSVYVSYHDEEWGVPEYDDRALFEKLVLDGFQAGLSWITILRKREAFRRAFEGFDPERVARYGGPRIRALLSDAGIVRHRGKIEAAVGNARAWLEVMERGPGFSALIWGFVDSDAGRPRRRTPAQVPTSTPMSSALSQELKARGFRFCGPTIMYAFAQAVGLVNDHLTSCFRHAPCQELGAGRRRR